MRVFWAFIGFIVLLVALFMMLSGGSRKTPKPTALNDSAYSNATLQYTIEGPIVAKENHNSIIIKVSAVGRQIDIAKGYAYSVANSKTYDNDQPAFDALREASRTVGFLSQNKNSTTTSIYSICPEGDRFIYQVFDAAGREIHKSWSTTCNIRSVETYGGNAVMVRQLFTDQIPDFETLTADISL